MVTEAIFGMSDERVTKAFFGISDELKQELKQELKDAVKEALEPCYKNNGSGNNSGNGNGSGSDSGSAPDSGSGGDKIGLFDNAYQGQDTAFASLTSETSELDPSKTDYDWDRKPGMDEWERKSIPFGSEETYNSVDAEAGGIDDIDVG